MNSKTLVRPLKKSSKKQVSSVKSLSTIISSFQKKIANRLIELTPGQLVVQVTDKCNAKCPQCSMRVASDFKRHTLDSEAIYSMIDHARSQNIKAISFTGGEPFLYVDKLCSYIKRAKQKKIPFIRTGTNGFHFTGSHKPGFTDRVNRLAEKLAETPLRNFWISLDSYDPAYHEQMRGFKGVVEGMTKAIPIFESHGIYPSVNLGINRNLGGELTRNLSKQDFISSKSYADALYTTYTKAFAKFYDTVVEMGFTIANACYPMSVDETCLDLKPVYQASATDHIIKFTPIEKQMIFKALRDIIPLYRHKLRIFSPQTSLHALVKELEGHPNASYPCQGGINYFFIDAKSGDTYPCGYRGQDNFGKLNNMDRSKPASIDQCRQCDWECFRDPSELAGPVIDLFSAPQNLIRKLTSDPVHLKYWATDLLYYQACDYFNGRKAPDYKKLARFSKNQKSDL